MINELILKNSPNSWLRNGFKKQCFMILFAVLYTGSQTSFKGLFISLFSILKEPGKVRYQIPSRFLSSADRKGIN